MACAGILEGAKSITGERDIAVLVAPDSFKGSLSAREASVAMEEGIHDVFPMVTVRCQPLSDGGEGLVDVLSQPLGAVVSSLPVAGPLPGQQVEARWGYAEETRTAIIEMAEAGGLGLVPPDQRNPLFTTTLGVGQLIKHALDRGARTLLVGIGGSATNDGGAGMARALGVQFRDVQGVPLPPGGGALLHLSSIDVRALDPRLKETAVIVACDVRNPLTGPEGASVVFGPQKGASPDEVLLLDKALGMYRRCLQETLHVDVQTIPGSGAAGGLGAGLAAFCGATLQSGIDLVLDHIGFEEVLGKVRLVLTGEGCIDSQTKGGKVLSGVLMRCRRHGIPVAAVVGDIHGNPHDFVGPEGFVNIMSLVDSSTRPQDAMANAHALLRAKTAQSIQRLKSLLFQ